MGGYVNRDCGGWTELRVHGVSGTPPENMLAHPHVARVAGDGVAGFYRRRWEAEQIAADTADERLEAYSWGGLTAGSGQRALWLLLTPFLLVNVAFWAVPYADVDDRGVRRALRQTGDAVQRLFALSMTLAFVLATVVVAMDFAGWQCARPSTACAERVPWLGFLSWPWLDLPGRRLAVTALLPLAVVGLLWWLANKTWQSLEATDVPPADPAETHRTPLEDRRMWNGGGPVRRLRAVHVSAAFALVGVFLLAPAAGYAPAYRPVATVLTVVALALLGAGVVLACLPRMSERVRPDADDRHVGRRDTYTLLPWLALALALLAAVVAAQPGVRAPGPPPAGSSLPWLSGTVHALAAAQVVLLSTMLVLLLLHRTAPPRPRPDDPAEQRPAWRGLAAVVFMMLAAALGATYAAGLAVTVAHLLGRPVPAGHAPDGFVVPMVYFWAAALTVPVAAAALLCTAAVVWLVRRATGRTLRDHVAAAYPAAGIARVLDARDAPQHAATLRRARRIAADWSWAAVSDVGGHVTGAFAIAVAALGAAGIVGYLVDPGWVHAHARWAVNLGDALVGGFVAGLLYVGRTAYRNPRFRRTVGVLWDVGTFWPRATHPLAPPCYAERAVPDLVRRVRHLGRTCGGHVLLSCHSQGTVLGAAVVMQLTYGESARVALLTYGSPLRRLYGRFFPAYFGATALRRTGAFLCGRPLDTTDAARVRWPWRNLYRPSDPIGGWILRDYPAVEITAAVGRAGDNRDVDRRIVDPAFARPPGDGCYPATAGHSGYPDDPAYRSSVEIVRKLRADS